MITPLPSYIFLLSDHTTRPLAVAAADAISTLAKHVVIEDFLAPIHESLTALLTLDWNRDLGDPRETSELLPDCTTPQTINDLIISLEKWFINRFGLYVLGKRARIRCDERNEIADYVTVFRDATGTDIAAFADIPDRDKHMIKLFVHDTVKSILAQLGV